MGTETRIGIATGLLIVVVASVYFFYGSDRSAEDLLIATGGPAAEPPKIPAGPEDRLASSAGHRPEPAPWRAVVPPHRTTKRPARVVPSGSGKNQAWKRPDVSTRQDRRTDGRRVVGATKPRIRSDVPIGTSARQSTKKSPVSKPLRKPLPLRSGPSEALVEATRQNARSVPPISPVGRTDWKYTAGRPAAVSAKPAISWPTRHKISAGDTLSDISLRYYSTSAQVKHILRSNPNIKNPKALKIGDILIIPAPAPITSTTAARTERGKPSQPLVGRPRIGDSGRAADSASTAARRYRVQSGDTLYRISRKMLGDPSRWKEIYARNRTVIGKDPLRLKPGMLLTLPG